MKTSSFVLIFCAFFVKNGQASKLSFEAFPNEVVQKITPSVSMMCRVVNTEMNNQQTRSASSPTDVHHITSMYILRGDDDVASITAFDPPTALVDLGNLNAKGSLSALSGEGTLELSWTNPSNMTLGEFTCTANGIDGRGHVVVLTSHLTMTSVAPSLMDLIDDINSKMGRQQQEITQLEQGKLQQQQEIQQQQQEIQQLQQENQQQQLENQQQHQNISNLQQENQQQHQNISNLQQDNLKQTQEIQHLEDTLTLCSVSVAFQASFSGAAYLAQYTTVVYDHINLNEGDAYDNTTGVFTCASPGVYAFNVQAASYPGAIYEVVLNMKLNNDVVSGLVAGYGHDNRDAASMSAVLQLNVGDVVKVEAVLSSYLYNTYSNTENGFNGHIVHPDACKP